MDRLTRMPEGGPSYIADEAGIRHDGDGYTGAAVEKLAKFENLYDDLAAKQRNLAAELEKLRSENRTHSVKFKQLLADKLTTGNILILFKSYGL